MDLLQELADLEAIKRLKASYFYFMDTKDWTSWLELFAADITLKWDSQPSSFGGDGLTSPEHRGIEALKTHVVDGILDKARTVHQGHTPLLEITSDTTAKGIWAMEDIVGMPDGTFIHGFGHYHETYRKIDGKWKIGSIHLTRLRMTSTTG